MSSPQPIWLKLYFLCCFCAFCCSYLGCFAFQLQAAFSVNEIMLLWFQALPLLMAFCFGMPGYALVVKFYCTHRLENDPAY